MVEFITPKWEFITPGFDTSSQTTQSGKFKYLSTSLTCTTAVTRTLPGDTGYVLLLGQLSSSI